MISKRAPLDVLERHDILSVPNHGEQLERNLARFPCQTSIACVKDATDLLGGLQLVELEVEKKLLDKGSSAVTASSA